MDINVFFGSTKLRVLVDDEEFFYSFSDLGSDVNVRDNLYFDRYFNFYILDNDVKKFVSSSRFYNSFLNLKYN